MISVREGQEHILAQITGPVPPEVLPVPRALGRVLAEDVQAPVDVPPADNSAVDGYAVGQRPTFRTPGRASSTWSPISPRAPCSPGRSRPGEALRIMTGAPMPAGADTVYPAGDRRARGARVRIGGEPQGASTCASAARTSGPAAVVLEAGTVLRPQELGLVASLGLCRRCACTSARAWRCSPPATRSPSPATPRKPGQIYDANRFSLARLGRGSAAARPLDLGIVPDRAATTLRARLLRGRRRRPTSCSPPAASRSAIYDLVKAVLARDRARSTSGRWPCSRAGRSAFGRIGATHFFGLPGNPVASLLTLHPLRAARRSGSSPGGGELFPLDVPRARPSSRCARRPGRREFKRGVLTYRDDALGGPHHGPAGLGHPLLDGRRPTASSSSRRTGATWRRARRVLVEPFA